MRRWPGSSRQASRHGLEYASAHLTNGGVLWTLKGQQDVIGGVAVRVALHREWASHGPIGPDALRTSFEPQRVAIERADGTVVDERADPRRSFAGHRLETPWDRLQLAYFAGYAMWTYFTTPFLFALEGVEAAELEPWHERGETWRRLAITFPPHVATHSTVQTFYVGPDGLLRRHDYDVDVVGGAPAAPYLYDYLPVAGIQVPTRRRVFLRTPDGSVELEPSIVTIDLSHVEFV